MMMSDNNDRIQCSGPRLSLAPTVLVSAAPANPVGAPGRGREGAPLACSQGLNVIQTDSSATYSREFLILAVDDVDQHRPRQPTGVRAEPPWRRRKPPV